MSTQKAFAIYTGEIKENALEFTRFGAIVAWLDLYLCHFTCWRWLMVKLDYEMYCARCGGCGYVDCCGIKCDQGMFCAKYYEDNECLNVGGFVRCIPWESVELEEGDD